jgi:hypothetical protein
VAFHLRRGLSEEISGLLESGDVDLILTSPHPPRCRELGKQVLRTVTSTAGPPVTVKGASSAITVTPISATRLTTILRMSSSQVRLLLTGKIAVGHKGRGTPGPHDDENFIVCGLRS